ncbi:MAG TPA: sigma 54-interacting transcriptional regulator [Vicinamibacterales bacterium]|nr:sigma 54-interacting transcriptional regulator [Vicinamibacterales bacterium]
MEPLGAHNGSSMRGRVLAPDLERDIECAAAVDSPVLISGDDRTAEWVARHIHDRSPRAAGPFIALSARAAHAGATLKQLLNGGRHGLQAGSLVITSIEQIPLDAQFRLTEAIAPPPGRPHLPLRLIATSSVWLLNRVDAGLFDEQLFRLLNAIQIRLTPIDRDRAEPGGTWRALWRGEA